MDYSDADPEKPRHPEITVQLTGQDGNAFTIIGVVRKALRRHPDAGPAVAETFTRAATNSASYDDLLDLVQRWVTVR